MRKLKEYYGYDADERSFDEKYGKDGDKFFEDYEVPEKFKKLFESTLDIPTKSKKLREMDEDGKWEDGDEVLDISDMPDDEMDDIPGLGGAKVSDGWDEDEFSDEDDDFDGFESRKDIRARMREGWGGEIDDDNIDDYEAGNIDEDDFFAPKEEGDPEEDFEDVDSLDDFDDDDFDDYDDHEAEDGAWDDTDDDPYLTDDDEDDDLGLGRDDESRKPSKRQNRRRVKENMMPLALHDGTNSKGTASRTAKWREAAEKTMLQHMSLDEYNKLLA
jgi:hypothetical protein